MRRTTTIQRLALAAATVILMTAATGCEDLPPNEYVPQYVVEGFLIVDEPIHGIKVMRSQPVTDTFRLKNSAVTDADVRIIVDGRSMQLAYRPDSTGVGEYYFPDTSEKVQPGVIYSIEVRPTDGGLLSGSTLTPQRISWVTAPLSVIDYPKDTIELPSPDSLKLRWTRSGTLNEYLVSVRCLDTLEYGKYLEPSSGEKNRRIARSFEENAPHYNDVTRWGFIPNTETPTVWVAFKWFGRHEITMWAADNNFIRWWKLTHWGANPEYDGKMANIKGGLGVFSSAAVARAETFLVKNQP